MTIKCNERTQDNEKWNTHRKIMMSQIHLPILINNYLSIKNLLNRTRITSVNVIL